MFSNVACNSYQPITENWSLDRGIKFNKVIIYVIGFSIIAFAAGSSIGYYIATEEPKKSDHVIPESMVNPCLTV
jgi:hypothetical protein